MQPASPNNSAEVGSGTPWLVAPDKSEIIGYDDAESIKLKTDWANKRGLRGVFFWQVDGDRMPDGSNPLQEAAQLILLSTD
jgi:chitinase